MPAVNKSQVMCRIKIKYAHIEAINVRILKTSVFTPFWKSVIYFNLRFYLKQ